MVAAPPWAWYLLFFLPFVGGLVGEERQFVRQEMIFFCWWLILHGHGVIELYYFTLFHFFCVCVWGREVVVGTIER